LILGKKEKKKVMIYIYMLNQDKYLKLYIYERKKYAKAK